MTKDARTFPVPWPGDLLLACGKCQKKLKGDPNLHRLSKFKKAIKRHNRRHPERQLHLVNMPCADLCPKNGITVINLANSPARLTILWSEQDIEAF
jgi:hypothetical protein